MNETGRNQLTLSFKVKEHIEHVVHNVILWDTVLECYQTKETLRLRGHYGKIGDKLDFVETCRNQTEQGEL